MLLLSPINGVELFRSAVAIGHFRASSAGPPMFLGSVPDCSMLASRSALGFLTRRTEMQRWIGLCFESLHPLVDPMRGGEGTCTRQDWPDVAHLGRNDAVN